MSRRLRPIGHEDTLSLVDHLSELRSRLIISLAVLAAAFGLCLWQNHALLSVINHPLDRETRKAIAHGDGPLGQTAITQRALLNLAGVEEQWSSALSAAGSGLSDAARARVLALEPQLAKAVAGVPRVASGDKPVTLGIGEPFTTTVTVTFYFALLLAMPLILYELYAFVLPALSPSERRVATPMLAAVPALFVTGVAFGYFVVLPAAVRFLQNFNSGQFNVLVQANPYYHFAALLLLAMGVIFQVPVAILLAVHAGIVTPAQLRKHRRYAIVASAAIAALLPGDAITMTLEALPIIVLYEVSILVASIFDRRAASRDAQAAAGSAAEGEQDGPQAPPPIPPIQPQ